MRPADCVVVVGVRAPEIVDLAGEEFRRLDRGQTVEIQHLVVGAVEGALRGGAVVADDVEHQSVLEHAEALQAVDQSAHVVVGVLQKAGIDLHLAAQDRFEVLGHVLPRGDLGMPCGELAVRRNHAEFLLPVESLLTQLVPAVIEAALVLVGPLLGHVVRGMGGPGCEIGEEGCVGGQGLLLTDPGDRLVGHVFHEVVTLFGGAVDLHRCGALIQAGIPLVGLTTDEAVEVLETSARRRPRVERPDRAGLPHRHLVALAELGGVVSVELQRSRDRRHSIG